MSSVVIRGIGGLLQGVIVSFIKLLVLDFLHPILVIIRKGWNGRGLYGRLVGWINAGSKKRKENIDKT